MKGISCITLMTLMALLLNGPLNAAEQISDTSWAFTITPYLWLPSIDGSLKYDAPTENTGSPEVKVGPSNYLESLSMALMLSGSARKERFSAFTDIIYLSFSNEKSSIKNVDFGGSRVSSSGNVSTDSSLKGLVWTLGAGYTVVPGRDAELDVFGGMRYVSLKVSTDWQLLVDVTGSSAGQTFPREGSISERVNVLDGVVGFKGNVFIGSSAWSVPYYLDVGAGSSSLTWQGLLGIAYTYKKAQGMLSYRHLYINQSSDNLIQNIHFSGPALSVTFKL